MFNFFKDYLRQRSLSTSVVPSRGDARTATPNNTTLIDATALEARILYSALPLIDFASVTPETIADLPNLQECPMGDLCPTEDKQSEESESPHTSEDHESSDNVLPRTVIFVDESVPDYHSLIDDIIASSETNDSLQIFMLDGERDGVEQVTGILSTLSDIDQVHFFSHGSSGEVQLGNTTLNSSSLGGYAGNLSEWSSSLSSSADILFYGCDLASGNGELLVQSISELTGADVAASDDATGHSDQGGDWTLELHVGLVEAEVAVSQQFHNDWQHILATYTVTNTNNGGAGSLRRAITDANSNSGTDTIEFNIPGGGVHTINLTSALPYINDTVIIDGTTESDFSGTPLIELNGASAGSSTDGLTLDTGSGGSTIRGLIINRFGGDGIRIDTGSNNNTIVGNYIGVTASGNTAAGNGWAGVYLVSNSNTIGGSTAADR
ncbi:MAG TPA: hypothetical protein DDW52_02890, partial [Planctomycetaceae bacterium]|nr:hypothetical protein [Planctomycetaceae bacterium]